MILEKFRNFQNILIRDVLAFFDQFSSVRTIFVSILTVHDSNLQGDPEHSVTPRIENTRSKVKPDGCLTELILSRMFSTLRAKVGSCWVLAAVVENSSNIHLARFSEADSLALGFN